MLADLEAPWYMMVIQAAVLLLLLSWVIETFHKFLSMVFRAPVRVVQTIIFVALSRGNLEPNWPSEAKEERNAYITAKMHHFEKRVIEGKAKRTK